MDARVPFSVAQAAFGVSATVTLPGEEPIADVTVVWLPPVAVDVPSGLEVQRMEMRRMVSLPADVVPLVPVDTVIVAPERDGDADATWRVDGPVYKDTDHTRVYVLPVGEDA